MVLFVNAKDVRNWKLSCEYKPAIFPLRILVGPFCNTVQWWLSSYCNFEVLGVKDLLASLQQLVCLLREHQWFLLVARSQVLWYQGDLLSIFLVEGVTKFQSEIGENVLLFSHWYSETCGAEGDICFGQGQDFLKFSASNPFPLGNVCVTLGL